MDFYFLLKGISIGFVMTIVIGPIAILCIHRSITKGRLAGFVSGMGAVLADLIYVVIAIFGLTLISSFLTKQQFWLEIVGIVILTYLGIKTFNKKPKPSKKEKNEEENGLLHDFFSIFILTIVNPITVVSFAAVFAGFGITASIKNHIASALIIIGFFIGASLTFFLLSFIAGYFHQKIESKILLWINRVSGSILLGFAFLMLLSFVNNLFY